MDWNNCQHLVYYSKSDEGASLGRMESFQATNWDCMVVGKKKGVIFQERIVVGAGMVLLECNCHLHEVSLVGSGVTIG